MVGIEMDDDCALALLDEIVMPRLEEFRCQFPTRDTGTPFHVLNGTFMAVDAHVYYAFLRAFQPRRVIEVGAGRSTQIAAAALELNRGEGAAAELIAIDPFPPAYLNAVRGIDEVIALKVQQVGLELFTSLASGDVLFIDSSHTLRGGDDVQFEYCELLPRLQPGVLVHVHDISLPKPYPRVYFEQGFYWNEQFLLQAFLTFNRHYRVVWPATYLVEEHPQRLEKIFPELADMRMAFPFAQPSSFWIVRSD
jgi:hypothetical protein